MSEQDNRTELLKTLAKNEEAVGRLYQTYAEKFPEHEEFWLGLVMEIIDHSNWIHELINKVEEGSTDVYLEGFTAEDIQSLQKYLDDQLALAKGGSVSLEEALATALKVEKNMIEQKYFEVVGSRSEELTKLMDYLAVSTENHIKLIEEYIDQWQSNNL